jgi:AraC-like DNA-binding protein
MVAHRHSASPRDTPRLAREIHVRPGIGVSAHVVQGGGLKMLRMQVDQSALIFVDRGIKTVKAAQGKPVRAVPGQAILVRAHQTVDFFNAVPDGTHFEARWLLFAGGVASDAYYVDRASRVEPAPRRPESLALVPRVCDGLADAFTRARQALAAGDALPDAVARQRMLEVLHWLLEDGVVVRSVPSESSTSRQVRSLIGASLDAQWTADRICHELALSQATLRRRLGTEGTTLTTLLVDARMSTALTLLQATARPVSDIAFAVGYESPSRFAIRFRQRFGFAPTDVRGRGRSALPA